MRIIYFIFLWQVINAKFYQLKEAGVENVVAIKKKSRISCVLYCKSKSIRCVFKNKNECVVLKGQGSEEDAHDGNVKAIQYQEVNLPFTQFPSATPITKDNIVTTISKLQSEYVIGFEVNPTSFPTGWTNIIHLTNNENNLNLVYGFSTPGIWSVGTYLEIQSAVNGDPLYKYHTNLWPVQQWTRVEISQTENHKHQLVYRIKINNQNVHQIVNMQPKCFNDVKVYISNPYRGALPGFIKGLYIINGPAR